MKITANGISINYTLGGPASAPVVTTKPTGYVGCCHAIAASPGFLLGNPSS